MNGKGPVRGPVALSQPMLQETFVVAGDGASRREIRRPTGFDRRQRLMALAIEIYRGSVICLIFRYLRAHSVVLKHLQTSVVWGSSSDIEGS